MKQQKTLIPGILLLIAFVIWTLAVTRIDVQSIGPQGSCVGFATLNQAFHQLAGVHMWLYVLTDWLSIFPLVFILGFGILGLTQWLKRRKLLLVDRSILILGGFYIVVMAVFLFFEFCVINYRPVLIEGHLEASYPSSTTMLIMCVIPTAVLQLKERIHNTIVYKCIAFILTAFGIFMVVSRLISGVHWLTDIIGGALVSVGLVMIYRSLTE